jgi:hypothetical protein
MIKPFIKEFIVPELTPNEAKILKHNGVKLSESSYKEFIPFVSIAVLNKSTENIKVFINETDDNAFRLTGNSSRALTGIPAWNISVQNLGDTSIAEGDIIITVINDLENTARYNAFAKGRGY